MSHNTSFDDFAIQYDQLNQDDGDYTHSHTVDPALFACLGDVKGKVIYDIACGNGYIARKLVKLGAKQVWASDISEKLVEIAKSKYPENANNIKYFARKGEDTSDLPENFFNVIVINMALHYFPDLETFFADLAKLLKRQGFIVFTTNHPMRHLARLDLNVPGYTAERVLRNGQEYLKVFEDVTFNLWTKKEELNIYRAPISHVVNSLASNGLLIDKMIEPKTDTNYDLDQAAESNIPMFFAMRARKV